jgi:methionine salvage enolase-phosphatase E1
MMRESIFSLTFQTASGRERKNQNYMAIASSIVIPCKDIVITSLMNTWARECSDCERVHF